jgi:hypothetical protein
MEEYGCKGGKKKIADMAAMSEVGGQTQIVMQGMAILK